MKIKYFRTPEELHKWFEKHHQTDRELQIGYYKKDSGKQSITWAESVAEALCFGWIDGIRPLYTTKTNQHLEQHQHQTGPGLN